MRVMTMSEAGNCKWARVRDDNMQRTRRKMPGYVDKKTAPQRSNALATCLCHRHAGVEVDQAGAHSAIHLVCMFLEENTSDPEACTNTEQ